eukprot:GEMP01020151.1.p1 GENE.GEMP01020151.1~~GEMP01020151.1.p1  ORF type:complete len:269 (+),score=42.44 GEMP01020151.1:468-1274(+)
MNPFKCTRYRHICLLLSVCDALISVMLLAIIINFLIEASRKKAHSILIGALPLPLVILAVILRVFSSVYGFTAFTYGSLYSAQRYIGACFVTLCYHCFLTILLHKYRFCPMTDLLALGNISADKVNSCWVSTMEWQCLADICQAPATLVGCANCVLRCEVGEYSIVDLAIGKPKPLSSVHCEPSGHDDAQLAKTLAQQDGDSEGTLDVARALFMSLSVTWIYFIYLMKQWEYELKGAGHFDFTHPSPREALSSVSSHLVSAEMKTLNV